MAQSMYAVAIGIMGLYLWRLMRRRPLGATTFFLFFFLLFNGPALYYYVNVWSAEYDLGLLANDLNQSDGLITLVFWAMTACAFSVWLGCLAGEWLFHPRRPRMVEQSLGVPALSTRSMNRVRIASYVLGLFVAGVLLTQIVFVSSPSSIFDYYLNPALSDVERTLVRREEQVGFYIYGVLLNTLVPLVSFILLAEANQRHRLFRYALFFGGVLLMAKVAQYTKAGPALICIQLLYAYSLSRRTSAHLSTKDFYLFIVGMLIIFGIVLLVGEGTDSLAFFYRMFMIPNEVIFEYFNAIPESYPFGYGRGISWIAAFTGDAMGNQPPITTPVHVASVLRGDFSTVVNTFFVADAWAEFQWPGIFIVSFLVGLLVRWYDAIIYRIRHASIRIGLTVAAVSGAFALSTSAMTTALITGGLLICPLFAMWLDGIRSQTQARTL